MKKLLAAATGLAVGAGVLVGIALAQNDWIPSLVQEYSAVWRAAYDETAQYNLPQAGREAIAEQVLDAHIATRTFAEAGNAPPSAGATLTPVPAPTATLEPTANPATTPAPAAGSALVAPPADALSPPPEPTATPVPTLAPGATPEPTPLPINLPPPLPPGEEPAAIAPSDVDGYITATHIAITAGGRLTITISNYHTAGGYAVILSDDGTLTVGGGGTLMEDRYWYFCFDGYSAITTSYASDEYGAALPKTELFSDSLFDHPTVVMGRRVCLGEQAPPPATIYVTF